MFQALLSFVIVGYCSCTQSGSTYEYGGHVYTIYRNVSETYINAIQYCARQGHDDIAHLCSPYDLAQILPPTHGKVLFWIRGPSMCDDIGRCPSLWYDDNKFADWVTTCTKCDQPFHFICQTAANQSTNSTTTTTPPTTTTSPSPVLSVCTETVIPGNNVEYVISPLILTYNKAKRVCQSKYQGELMDLSEAGTKLTELTRAVGTSTVFAFWLKETSPGVCNVVTSSGNTSDTNTSCSYVYGSICARYTANHYTRILSATSILEATFTNHVTLSNVISTSGVMAARTVRSMVDCASNCSINSTCLSFFFVSDTRLCQMHDLIVSAVSGSMTPHQQTVYYTKNV